MIQTGPTRQPGQASASLPVRVSEMNQLGAFKQQYPPWSQVQQWIPVAQPAPRLFHLAARPGLF